MHVSNKPYIPDELCIAPQYRLANNIGKELPGIEPEPLKSQYLDYLAEISAYQFFEEIPGINKKKIPINSKEMFEIWEPMSNRILLPEDLDFLKQDNVRIEAIVEKLVWLGDSWLNSIILDKNLKIKNWEDALNIIVKYSYNFEFATINFYSAQIVLKTKKDKFGVPIEYWGVYPACWDICLIKTRTFNGGFIIDDYNTPYKFNIKVWVGIPFFRNTRSGEVITMESWD